MGSLYVGQPAPLFSAPDQYGVMHSLEDYRDEWVLLYFYPKDNTPGCTEEACQLRYHYQVLARQMQIIGISADSVESHAEFAAKHSLPFTLLADPQKEIIRAYGVAGIPLTKRSSFLISPEGNIVKIYEKVKPSFHAKELHEGFENIVETIYQAM